MLNSIHQSRERADLLRDKVIFFHMRVTGLAKDMIDDGVMEPQQAAMISNMLGDMAYGRK